MANQTHKTIIFEEFDTAYNPNLYTILDNNPTGDTLVKELEKLTVKTFDEFMTKFAPKVYEITGSNPATGNIEFFYTTTPEKFPNCSAELVNIREHAFYKMLSKLYTSRGAGGKPTLHFDDKEVLEMLTPKKDLEIALDLRQKMEYNLQLFYEAKARGDRGGKASAKAKISECREKISEYAKSSLNKLLPILIEDTDRKLKLLGAGKTGGGSESGKIPPQLEYGVLYLNAAGQIDIDTNRQTLAIVAPKNSSDKNTALVVRNNNLPAQVNTLPANTQQASKSLVPDKQKIQNQIAETIAMDYDEIATYPNEQIRSLILSTFAPLSSSANTGTDKLNLNAAELIARRKQFEDVYTNAIKSFAAEMSQIVESLLGVKTFFDHATADGGEYSEIPNGVIIANCKASRLLKIRDKFKGYMKYLGGDQTDSRIWFAVVPSVFQEPPVKFVGDEDEDDDEPFGGSLKEKSAAASSDEEYVSINAIKEFLGIMEEAKIMTIFNVRVKDGNTFSDLSAAEVESKIAEFESCDYAHAVYAYPNFTLINERDYHPFAKEGDESEHSNACVTLPSIFTDAAYPAAGLLVAAQQPKVLEKRKLKYIEGSVCVSVDFEDVQVKKKLPTKFNRESVLRRGEDVTRAINKNMFGFVFSGDEVADEDGVWKNSYVHCARTLKKIEILKENNQKVIVYKPIYQTLTEDYVYQEFLRLTSKKKSNVERKLIKKINKEYEEKNALYKESVNRLLREGENLHLEDDGDKYKIRVHFVGGDSDIEADVEND